MILFGRIAIDFRVWRSSLQVQSGRDLFRFAGQRSLRPPRLCDPYDQTPQQENRYGSDGGEQEKTLTLFGAG